MHYFKYEAICHLENDMTVCHREFIDVTLVLTSIPSVVSVACCMQAPKLKAVTVISVLW